MIASRQWLSRIAAALSVCLFWAGLSACGFIEFRQPQVDTDPPVSDSASAPDTDPIPDTAPDDTAAPEEKLSARDKAIERLNAFTDRTLRTSGVIIAAADGETVCPIASEDPIIAARADCAQLVGDKFGASLFANVRERETLQKEIIEAYQSGTYYADLLAVPQSMVGSLAAAGALGNMLSLPFADYSADYYDGITAEASTSGHTVYAVSGDASFNPEYLSGVYFNRDLAESLGIGNLYEDVYNGTWTVDRMREAARIAAFDLNGNASGRYGHASELSQNELVALLAASQDIRFTANERGARPDIVYMDGNLAERSKAAVDKIYALLYSDKTLASVKDKTAHQLFTGGELLFCTERLYLMTWMPNSAVNWGLLPLPKYDASQENYRTLYSGDAPVFCYIGNTPNYETTGLVLEALNLVSHEYVREVYLNERIHYVLRDNDSILMLETILDSADRDFVHMFGPAMKSVNAATASAVYNAVTTRSTLQTLYKNNQSAADKEITSFFKLYK